MMNPSTVDRQIMLFRDLDDFSGAVVGSSRVLEFNMRTKLGRDFFLSMPQPFSTATGVVLIAFDNVNRTTGGEVEASEFGCTLTLSGAAALSRPQPVSGWTEFDDSISNLLLDIYMLF